MLVFSDVSIRRGARLLFGEASLSIPPGQKVGITGANGVGKSSLFALILGELSADTGNFSLPPGWVIAHVAQHTPAGEQSALDYVLHGDREYIQLRDQIADADGVRLAQLHARIEEIDGYTAESRAATLLHGLGFTADQVTQPLDSFSGGWRMRLNLAQALMCRSDLLLLDEPTNHLDLDAVIWLQSWLARYPGTLLLISHDREFLDSFVTMIANIEQQRITLYKGHYSDFERRRAEQLAQQQAAYQRQQKTIAHIHQFVSRFGAKATKARQAQSRLKTLQRMERIAPAHIDTPFQFSFREPDKLPERLLNTRELVLGYDDVPLLAGITLQLHPGDRIGLIGPNGAGKSTLIKYLAGALEALGGESFRAQYLVTGYFAQHQVDQLDAGQSPLQHLRHLDGDSREQELRDYLGGFGFQGERVDEAVAPFSGGEKARLVLALLIYQKPNLLLLDEPTNHLDLEMRQALAVALQAFSGAMLIVSHDRFLLKAVCDQLLLVHDGEVADYDGDLDDYARWIQGSEARPDKRRDAEVSANRLPTRKERKRIAAEQRRQLQPLKKAADDLEQQIDELTSQRDAVNGQLADPLLYDNNDNEQITRLMQEKARLDAEIEQRETAWMDAVEAYENAQQGLVD